MNGGGNGVAPACFLPHKMMTLPSDDLLCNFHTEKRRKKSLKGLVVKYLWEEIRQEIYTICEDNLEGI